MILVVVFSQRVHIFGGNHDNFYISSNYIRIYIGNNQGYHS
jgi:hypothetical protein